MEYHNVIRHLSSIIADHKAYNKHQDLKDYQVEAIESAINYMEHYIPYFGPEYYPMQLGIAAWPENLYNAIGSECIPPYNNEQINGLQYLLDNTLTNTEKIVLLSRFKNAETLTAIAKKLGCTTHNVMQTEKHAVRKMAKPNRKRIMELGKEKADEIAYKLITNDTTNSQTNNTPIEELNLSTRTYNALIRKGIKFISELTDNTETDLLKIRNLGEKGVTEIKTELAKYSLYIKEN